MTIGCSTSGTGRLALGDELAQSRTQRIQLEGLGHRVAHAEASSMRIETRGGRQQENRRLPRPLLTVAIQEGFRVHSGHDQVEQDHIDGPLLQERESCLGARPGLDVPAIVDEGKPEELTGWSIIVHD